MQCHSGITKPSLAPAEVEMLYGILVQWCVERGCGLNSDRCREAAKEAVSWFEWGIRERPTVRASALPVTIVAPAA
jgi:hypothetical protein